MLGVVGEISLLLILCGILLIVLISIRLVFRPLKGGQRDKRHTYRHNFFFELKYLLLGLIIFYASMMALKDDFHWNYLKLAVMLVFTVISAALMALDPERKAYLSPITSGKGLWVLVFNGFAGSVFLQIAEFGSIPEVISFYNNESGWVVGLFVMLPISIAVFAFAWCVIILPYHLIAWPFWYHARAKEKIDYLESEINTLRWRRIKSNLNPHFVFNTLNTVVAVIPEEPSVAVHMVENLSSLLREYLRNDSFKMHSLNDEMMFIQQYLELLKERFSERIVWSFKIEEGMGDFKVPSLVLQPLVENAMIHGALDEGGVLKIRIHATSSESTHVISVRNNGPKMRENSKEKMGVTLVREMVDLGYRENGSLSFENTTDGVSANINVRNRVGNPVLFAT